jgi:hypothetical protein
MERRKELQLALDQIPPLPSIMDGLRKEMDDLRARHTVNLDLIGHGTDTYVLLGASSEGRGSGTGLIRPITSGDLGSHVTRCTAILCL